MKITIWIRPDASGGRCPMLRTDVKYESRDTPVIQNFGTRLVKAIEEGGEVVDA